jgi:hypothetical protein
VSAGVRTARGNRNLAPEVGSAAEWGMGECDEGDQRREVDVMVEE